MGDTNIESILRKNNTNKLYNIVYTPKSGYILNSYSKNNNYIINKPNYNSTSQKSRYESIPSNFNNYTVKSPQYLFSVQPVYSNAPSGNYNPQSRGRWARENRKLWSIGSQY